MENVWMLEEKNINWKGNEVSRGPLLEWVKRRVGRPSKCEICGTTVSGRFIWFSKSGEYKRDITDYIRLCASCFTKTYHKAAPRKNILCACGCGQIVKWQYGKYVKGHSSKIHPTFLGKRHTEQYKKDQRERTLKNRPWELIYKRNQSGEKNPNWNGGSSTENQLIRASKEYELWRTACFQRDNYTCVWCGSKKDLEVDHIKPFSLYPGLRFAIDNGRTLCKPCHKKTDTFGYRGKHKI